MAEVSGIEWTVADVRKPAGVIETHHTNGDTEWGYSFTSHNPDSADYVRCYSEADAWKLAARIERALSAEGGARTVSLAEPAKASGSAPNGNYPHEQMDALAADRYKVVPTNSGFWPFAVKAGDGEQELYKGNRNTCDVVAKRLTGAFLDGGFAAANLTRTEAESNGPSAYCRDCQAVGMSNCSEFDKCSGATCITCHRPFNPATPSASTPQPEPKPAAVEVTEYPKKVTKTVCDGCPSLRTKQWRDHLDNDETDSGTEATCEQAGRRISVYWREGEATPAWCPLTAALQEGKSHG